MASDDRHYEELLLLLKRLYGDADRCQTTILGLLQSAKPGDTSYEHQIELQFWIRTWVRAFFAMVEGLSHYLREITLRRAESGNLPDDLQQELEAAKRRPRIADNLRLAFAAYTQSYGVAYKPEYGREGWAALKRSIKIRNQITHPKDNNDLLLSGDVVTTVGVAFEWFAETCSELMDHVAEGS